MMPNETDHSKSLSVLLCSSIATEPLELLTLQLWCNWTRVRVRVRVTQPWPSPDTYDMLGQGHISDHQYNATDQLALRLSVRLVDYSVALFVKHVAVLWNTECHRAAKMGFFHKI